MPRTVAFKSNSIQLFLLGTLFGVPEGFQAALDFIGFHGQKRPKKDLRLDPLFLPPVLYKPFVVIMGIFLVLADYISTVY